MRKLFQSNWIEVICGPMFSGKTEELLRKLNRFHYAKIDFIIFKPIIDTRSGDNKVISRDGRNQNSIIVSKPSEIIDHLCLSENKDIRLVAIDETQFFDSSIVDVVQTLARNGYHIIMTCLDKDYLGKPFGAIPTLLAIADSVQKLTAICTICGKDATQSKRIAKPSSNVSQVMIGDKDTYEARCNEHHEEFMNTNSITDLQYKQKFSK